MDLAALRAELHAAIDRDWPEIAASPLAHGWNGVVQLHVSHETQRVGVLWSVGKAVTRTFPDEQASPAA